MKLTSITSLITALVISNVLVSSVDALKVSKKKNRIKSGNNKDKSNEKNPVNAFQALSQSKWLGGNYQLAKLTEDQRKRNYEKMTSSKSMCRKIEQERKEQFKKLKKDKKSLKQAKPIVKYLKNKSTGKVMKITSSDCYRFSLKKDLKKLGTVRYDRQFTPGDWRGTRRNFAQVKNLRPSKRLRGRKSRLRQKMGASGSGSNHENNGKVLTAAEAFIIDFKCDLTDKALCEKAKAAYSRATKSIGDVLQVKKPIVVKAEFISFCKNKIDCNGDILGQADASAHWLLNPKKSSGNVDPLYRYPQPLAKQLTVEELDWNRHDLIAQFNGDLNSNGKTGYWFREDNKPITKTQYDFEYVILHEMLHGLGFGSSWNTYIPSKNENDPVPLLIPNYNFEETSNGRVMVNGLLTPGIFDKFVFVKKKNMPLTESFYIMADKGLSQRMSFEEWAAKFEKLPAFDEAQKLYALATDKETMEFRVPKNENRTEKSIVLHTRERPFTSGTSLSHVDQVMYTGQSDFLMRPRADEGKILEHIDHRQHPIGPFTLDILETIGWTVVRPTRPGMTANVAKWITGQAKAMSTFFLLP